MKNHNVKTWTLTAMVSAALVMSGCSGPAVVPTSYTTYNAKDGSFLIHYPAGWEAKGGGKSGYAWAKFTSGSAEIKVETSTVGSLMGDISKSGILPMGVEAGAEDRTPVAAVHQTEKKGFEEDEGVQEKKPVAIQTGLGDSRRSEFTGSATFGGVIHGYRATALSRDVRVRVVCRCSESQWKALQPTFDKVIESLEMGTR